MFFVRKIQSIVLVLVFPQVVPYSRNKLVQILLKVSRISYIGTDDIFAIHLFIFILSLIKNCTYIISILSNIS